MPASQHGQGGPHAHESLDCHSARTAPGKSVSFQRLRLVWEGLFKQSVLWCPVQLRSATHDRRTSRRNSRGGQHAWVALCSGSERRGGTGWWRGEWLGDDTIDSLSGNSLHFFTFALCACVLSGTLLANARTQPCVAWNLRGADSPNRLGPEQSRGQSRGRSR